MGGAPARKDSEKEAEAREENHQGPVFVHVRNVSGIDAFVDYRRRDIRYEDPHDDLGRGPHRSEDSRCPVLLDLS